jgi:hypothetical protein
MFFCSSDHSWNNMYMLILNFTYPLRCLCVPPVEYHCSKWSKVAPASKPHAVKAHRESGGIAPRILNFDTRWKWLVSARSGRSVPGIYPISSWVGRGYRGEEEKSLPLPEMEPRLSSPGHRLWGRCTVTEYIQGARNADKNRKQFASTWQNRHIACCVPSIRRQW